MPVKILMFLSTECNITEHHYSVSRLPVIMHLTRYLEVNGSNLNQDIHCSYLSSHTPQSYYITAFL